MKTGNIVRLCIMAIAAIGLFSMSTVSSSAQLPIIPKVRVKGGLFLPSDSNLTNAVGNTWVKIGADMSLPIGFNLPIVGASTRVGIDMSFKNSNRIVPITISEIIQPSAGVHSPIYGGAGFGLWNGHISGNTSTKFGFRLIGGLDLTEKFFIEANYDNVGNLGGVRADGFSVVAGFKF